MEQFRKEFEGDQMSVTWIIIHLLVEVAKEMVDYLKSDPVRN